MSKAVHSRMVGAALAHMSSVVRSRVLVDPRFCVETLENVDELRAQMAPEVAAWPEAVELRDTAARLDGYHYDLVGLLERHRRARDAEFGAEQQSGPRGGSIDEDDEEEAAYRAASAPRAGTAPGLHRTTAIGAVPEVAARVALGDTGMTRVTPVQAPRPLGSPRAPARVHVPKPLVGGAAFNPDGQEDLLNTVTLDSYWALNEFKGAERMSRRVVLGFTFWPHSGIESDAEAIEDVIATIKAYIEKRGDIVYTYAGFEQCPDTGRVHAHAFVRYSSMKAVRALMEHLPKGVHVEVLASPKIYLEYCKKDSTALLDGDGKKIKFEHGVMKESEQGKRSDWEAVRDSISAYIAETEYPSCADWMKLNVALFTKQIAECPDGLRHIFELSRDKVDVCLLTFENLSQQQRELVRIIEGPVDERRFHVVLGVSGGEGKTVMSQYLQQHHKAQVIGGGIDKASDLALAVDPQAPILVIDPGRAALRTADQMRQLAVIIESVKSCNIFVGKYRSHSEQSRPKHVIVMVNEWNEEFARDCYSSDRVIMHKWVPRKTSVAFVPEVKKARFTPVTLEKKEE